MVHHLRLLSERPSVVSKNKTILSLYHGNVNSSSVAFVFGIFQPAEEKFYLVFAIDAVVIDGIPIRSKRAFFVPIAEG